MNARDHLSTAERLLDEALDTQLGTPAGQQKIDAAAVHVQIAALVIRRRPGEMT